MVASQDTVEAIARVVRAHVDGPTWRRILEDLARVPGNKSFRETIQRLITFAQDATGEEK